jgi:hypothetical protein
METVLCAAVGTASHHHGLEACTVYGYCTVCGCRHSKSSAWVRSMYCVCTVLLWNVKTPQGCIRSVQITWYTVASAGVPTVVMCNAFCRPRSYELAMFSGKRISTEMQPLLLGSVVVFVFSTPVYNLDEKWLRKFELELPHYLMTLSGAKIIYL